MIKRNAGSKWHVLSAVMFVTLCVLQLGGQDNTTQTSTVLHSTLSSSSSVIAPPRYFVGVIPLPDSDSEKPGCPAAGTKIQVTAPKKVLAGETAFKISAKTDKPDKNPLKVEQVSGVGTGRVKTNGLYVLPVKPGMARLKVEEDSNCPTPAQAATVDLSIGENEDSCVVGLERLPDDEKPDKPDAASLVQYLGNPYPFSFQAAGDKILVYSSRPMTRGEQAQLDRFKAEVAELVKAGSTAGSPGSTPSKPAFSLALLIPHAAALGDAATQINALNYSDFTAQDVGTDEVRITSSKAPGCKQLTAYLRDIRRVVWKPRPENSVAKLFHLNTSDVSSAFGSGGGTGGSSGGMGSGSAGGSGSTAGGGANGSASPASGSNATTTSATSGASATSASTGASPSGSAMTPSTSSSGTGAQAMSGGSGGSGGSGATSGAGASQSASATVSPIGTDLLLISDAIIGNDGIIAEKKRLLALLDLPRPEVILNIWTVQASSKNGKLVGEQTERVNHMVRNHNDVLEDAVRRGWNAVRNEMNTPDMFFDKSFYTYLVGSYVGPFDSKDYDGPEKVAQRVVNGSIVQTTIPKDIRQSLGLCPEDQYCLGYRDLFQPIKPRLTDLLLAVIASSNPPGVVENAINEMEKEPDGSLGLTRDCPVPAKGSKPDKTPNDCRNRDAEGDRCGNHFYLECFRGASKGAFGQSGNSVEPASVQPTSLGLLRASLADFLFEYRMSQLYPHEFSYYQLNRSAHALDGALAPLIDAFNRDLAAYQQSLTAEISERAKSAGLFGSEKDTFLNQGLITVRTISSTETTVSTTTQNFLDVTQQPTLSALVTAVQGQNQSKNISTSGKLTDVFQNLTPIQAQVLLGAVSQFQTQKVQIGRSMSIDITPRSLSGADSAELAVKLNVDEAANPTYYSSSGTSQGPAADISRVANHDTNTRIRVDSIKLFNVSTMTAQLQKARTRFPLLPPLVEIPYIGTLVGVPLPPAKEFHSSSAVISAIVVPTASDIALGLNFNKDMIVDADGAGDCAWLTPSSAGMLGTPDNSAMQGTSSGPHKLPRCRFRYVPAYADINDYDAISLFHQKMIACIANSGEQGTPTIDKDIKSGAIKLGTNKDCDKLSLGASGLIETYDFAPQLGK